MDVLESLERADRLRGARAFQANIKLNGFLARSRAVIGDVGAYRQIGVRRMLGVLKAAVQCFRAQLRGARLGRTVTEARVGQSVPKRKLWAVLLVDIARYIFDRAFPRRLVEVRIACRTARIERVVVKRLLSNGARPGHRKFSAWIRFSEECPHQGGAGLHSRKPRGQDSWNMFKRPGKSERASAEQNKNDRFSSGNNRLQELLLHAWQSEMRTRSSFSRHLRSIFAQRKNHGVRVLSGLNGRGQLFVRCFSDAAALCIAHVIRA